VSKKLSFWRENFNHRLGTILTLLQFKHRYATTIILLFYSFFRILFFPYFFIRRLFVKPTIILNNLAYSMVKLTDLPDIVGEKYKRLFDIQRIRDINEPDFINLDDSINAFYHYPDGGPWAGSQYFILNGQKFELMGGQGNKQNPPFILYQLKLYYVPLHLNLINPSLAEFGVIDLSNHIKIKNNS
jgi:hypothetical protein